MGFSLVGEANRRRHLAEMLMSWGEGSSSRLRAGPLTNEILIH